MLAVVEVDIILILQALAELAELVVEALVEIVHQELLELQELPTLVVEEVAVEETAIMEITVVLADLVSLFSNSINQNK